jgi:hypothetical protein
MNIDRNSLLFGIGLGFIFLSLILYGVSSFASSDAVREMSNSEIMTRARALGMVSEDDIPEPPELTLGEIIEMARVVGMVFEDEIYVTSPVTETNPAPVEQTTAPTSDPTPPPTSEPTPEPVQTPALTPEPVPTPEPVATPEPAGTPAQDPSLNSATVEAVRVASGATPAGIAGLLFQNGIITDEAAFAEHLRQALNGGTVSPGLYLLPKLADHGRLVEILLDN